MCWFLFFNFQFSFFNCFMQLSRRGNRIPRVLNVFEGRHVTFTPKAAPSGLLDGLTFMDNRKKVTAYVSAPDKMACLRLRDKRVEVLAADLPVAVQSLWAAQDIVAMPWRAFAEWVGGLRIETVCKQA